MRVSVVVPTWRRPADLSRCLAGLAAQTRTPDEVVVVVRGEDAETWELLRHADHGQLAVRGARVEVSGVVAALDTGLRAAEGDVVAITDDDSVPRPDWLARIERRLRDEPGVGGVGGRDYVHEGGKVLDDGRPEVGRVRWFGRVIGNHHLGVGPARDVDLLKGVNMAFRGEALRGLQIAEGLRGSSTQVHWEVDLCLTVKAAGWRLVYDPAIAVDHYPAQRFDEDQREARPVTALRNEVFNLTYVLLSRLSPWRGLVVLLYGLLVGTREAPGLLTALERTVRGPRALAAFRACERARIAALGAHLRRRRA